MGEGRAGKPSSHSSGILVLSIDEVKTPGFDPSLLDFQVILVGKLGERRMGLGLIPERHGRDVILEGHVPPAGPPPEGLDRHLDILLKPDRVHDVPPVQAEALLRIIMSVRADHLR